MRLLLASILLTCAVTGCGSSGNKSSDAKVNNEGPGLWTESTPDAVSFSLEQVFGAEEDPIEATLAGPNGVSLDDAGNVYIVDSRDNRLVSFSADGSFRWSAGRAGAGPGEFENAWEVTTGPDGLYVTNIAATRIDRYSFDGEYLESIAPHDYGAGARASLIGFTDESMPVLVGFLPGKSGAAITVYDVASDSTFSKFDVDISDSFEIPAGFGLTPDVAFSAGMLTRGHFNIYKQAIYSADGSLVRIVTRDLNTLQEPGVLQTDDAASLRTFSQVGAPRRIGANRWLSVSYWATNVDDPVGFMRLAAEDQPEVEYRYSVDIFDDKGILLWSREYDGESPVGSIMMTTDDGDLYSSSGTPFPQIRRYRVHMNQR